METLDELAFGKMQRIDKEVMAGRREVYSEAQVRSKYGLQRKETK